MDKFEEWQTEQAVQKGARMDTTKEDEGGDHQ
jgi:hypothetical protein